MFMIQSLASQFSASTIATYTKLITAINVSSMHSCTTPNAPLMVGIPVVTPVSTTLFRVTSLIPTTFWQLSSSNCTPKKIKEPSSCMDPRRRVNDCPKECRPSLDGPFIYSDGTKPYTVCQNDSK
ncbi:hypothetical protein C5167_042013 [Papaver somniferum]|nr:hypothetical protein C5167_042013 [Papaver somniferum]